MKMKILTLIAAGLVLFSSCSKEEIDPVLEIFITTKASDNWEDLTMTSGHIRFAFENEEGDQGWASTQPTSRPSVTIDADLRQQESMLVFNDRHFDQEKVLGIHMNLIHVFLKNADQGDLKLDVPWYTFTPFNEIVLFENGKTYRIEIIFDLDEMVFEEDGIFKLGNNYELEVSEL